AVERKHPEVVAMLRDHRFAVRRVAGDAVRRLRTRLIELEIDEARRRRPAERLGRRAVEVVRLELVVLPVEEVVAVRGNAEDVLPSQHVLRDERSLTGARVDTIDVRRGPLVVGDVPARISADRPASIWPDVELAHRRIGELDELRARNVEGFAIGEVAIL